MDDKKQFYNVFYAALEKSIKVFGGQLSEIELYKEHEADQGMQGIQIKFNNQVLVPYVYPEVYFDDWKEGMPVSGLTSVIAWVINQKVAEVLAYDFSSVVPEEIKEHLHAAVTNYQLNKGWLQDIPHEQLLDLAVYAKYEYANGYEAMVDKQMLSEMHMTKEELFQAAKENAAKERELHRVEELALDYIYEYGIGEGDVSDLVKDFPGSAYVYDCRSKVKPDGAAILSDSKILKQIQEQLADDFYILPCSVDQVLILPKSDCTIGIEGMEKFIRNMNEREIPMQDQLSSNIYEFDGTRLKMANDNLRLHTERVAKPITRHRSR